MSRYEGSEVLLCVSLDREPPYYQLRGMCVWLCVCMRLREQGYRDDKPDYLETNNTSCSLYSPLCTFLCPEV